MAQQAQIIFTCRFESEQTDCRECLSCEDIIFSDMWRLLLISKSKPKIKVDQSEDSMALEVDINISQRVKRTDIVICSSCYEAIEIP